MTKYTHYGWFYFVPILFADIDGAGCKMEMRWTGWQWPIILACSIHNLISTVSGVESDWPIKITGEVSDD